MALEVAEAIDAVYEHIEGRFLDSLHAGIAEKFNASVHARNWTLNKEVEEPSRARRYAGVYLYPRRTERPHYLYFPLVISRESSEYSIYYGLEWWGKSDEQPEEFPTGESGPLIAFLEDQEFERNKWTLGWKAIASFMSRKELTLALNQRAVELAGTAVEDFWVFFEKTADMVQVANDSLESRPKRT